MASRPLELDEISARLRSHIESFERLKQGDLKAVEVINVNLNSFFSGINSKSIEAEESEIEELNMLFGMLNKKGVTKARKAKLIYDQPKVIIKASKGKAKIKVYAALTKTAEPASVQKPGTFDKNKPFTPDTELLRVHEILRGAVERRNAEVIKDFTNAKSVSSVKELGSLGIDVMTAKVGDKEFARNTNRDGTIGGFVEKTAEVEMGVILEKNVVVMDHAKVGGTAEIRGQVVIAENATVMNSSISGYFYIHGDAKVSHEADMDNRMDRSRTVIDVSGSTRVDSLNDAKYNEFASPFV